MANEPRAKIKVSANFDEAYRQSDVFVSRLEKKLSELNKQAISGKTVLPFGIDEKALQNYKQISEQIKQINVIRARNEAKLAEETARQNTKIKQSELRQFENTEKSKQKIVEISAQSQLKQTELFIKATENAKKREFQEYQRIEREKNRFTNQQNPSNETGRDILSGIFGNSKLGQIAFASTAIGGFTSAIRLGVDALESLGSKIFEVGKDSVVLAGEFEATQNALGYVSGNAFKARQELITIDEVARNTVGLKMEAAEVGYTRLRNLGFAAEQSKGFVKGLAEQRIISRADEQSIDRVIVNLTQLRAGSNQATKDIKEIIHALPSMAKVFNDAFGTSNSQQLGKIFNQNPKEALDKLAEAMSKNQGISGGLINSWEKLEDAWTRVKRSIGEPVIDDITEGIKNLTNWLDENKTTWEQWGTIVKGVYEDVSSLLEKTPQKEKGFWEKFGDSINSINPAYILAQKYRQDLLTRNQPNIVIGDDVSQLEALKKAHDEQSALRKQQQEDLKKKQLDADAERLEFLKDSLKAEQDVIKGSYQVKSALLDVNLRFTLADELRYIQDSRKIKNDEAAANYKLTQANLLEQLKLQDGNLKATTKIKAELSAVNAKYNTEILLNNLQTQKAILENEQRTREQSRKNQLDFNQLRLKELSNSLGSSSFDVNRSINFGSDLEANYQKLKIITQTNYEAITKIVRENYQIQLQNERLTVNEKVNLNKQMYLDLQDLAEQNRQKQIEISDKEFNEKIKKTDLYIEKVRSMTDSVTNLLQKISFTQKGSVLSVMTSQFFAFDDVDKEIAKTKQNLEGAKQVYKNLKSQKNYLYDEQHLNDLLRNQLEIVKKYQKALNDLEFPATDLSQELLDLMRLGKQFDEGKVSIEDFDKAQRLLLKTTQDYNLFGLEKQRDALADKVQRYKNRGDETNALIAQNQLDSLNNQIDATKMQNSIDLLNQYRNSFDGLSETLQKFQSGDRTTWLEFYDSLRKQDISKQIDQIKSLAQAQIELGKANIIKPIEIRANVLEYLAQQKNINQSISSGIISAFDKSLDYLNQKLGKLGDIPILGDLAKFSNSQFLSKITTGFLDKFFPSLSKTQTDNPIAKPIIAEQGKTNEWLSKIYDLLNKPFAGGSGGGGGTGGAGGGIQSVADIVNLVRNTGQGNLSTSGSLMNQITLRGGETYTAGQGNLLSNLKSFFSGKPGGVFGEQGFGNNVGTYGAIGGFAQLAGGLIGGKWGGIIGGAGSGLATGAQIGTMILPGIGTAVGAAIGATVGALFGWLKNRKLEKKDKNENIPQLQKGFTDAMAQFRELIAHPTDNALEQANQIRAQIAAGFGVQFQTKKYSQEAQKLIAAQLNEIDKVPDGLMEQLKASLARMRQAKEFSNRFVATFADGGLTSNFSRMNNFSLGYQDLGSIRGRIPGIYDRKDDKIIRVTGNEVVLTPDQWMPITPYLQRKKVPGFANGGAGENVVIPSLNQQSAPTVNNYKIVLSGVIALPDAKGYLESPDGKKQVIDIVGDNIDGSNGNTGLPRKLNEANKR